MMKHIYVLIALCILLLIAGCGGDKITGQVTLDIKSKSIQNGMTTTIEVSGKNTGNKAVDVILNIIPEDTEKLVITYPGSLEFKLQPNEDTGTKIVHLKGYTEYSSTRYWIKVQLIDKINNKILDEEIQWITVSK